MELIRHEPGPRLSRVVEHGDILYCCGHVGAGVTMAEQAAALLKRYDELLEKYGSDKRHMLSVAVYLSDISLKPAFDAVWDAWIDEGTAPARHCVEAKLGSPEYLVEVVVIAVKKK